MYLSPSTLAASDSAWVLSLQLVARSRFGYTPPMIEDEEEVAFV